MATATEIATLIKYSPNREHLLGEIKQNIGWEDSTTGGILKFCPTRWTVRAICFRRILDNYDALLEEWTLCFDTRLDTDVRGRIIGCQAQMNSFDFFFGLHLGERLFAHTDNLSKTLQKKKKNMSAVNGQRPASLTKEVLHGMRSDYCFSAFYATVLRKMNTHPTISQPKLPRKRRAPARFEVGQLHFEAIDLIVFALNERFSQPGFEANTKLESLLLKAMNNEDFAQEMQFVAENYSDDINMNILEAHLAIFRVLMRNFKPTCFSEILTEVKQLSKEEQLMMQNVINVCRLLHVSPATSATGERSFSTARRIKTWLRSNMLQRRFNSLAILNSHKERTDQLCLHSIGNEFVSRNASQKLKFVSFKSN
ncbi:52 kDa repressor of the inhibitor of the protein kinase [Holothuria leucospilota]|uniref:52 kDa repressor of the inhibitor of the protein kinase n=1 Tax=Holothuria leucospilota TaxID=206669 RepID=A0A9Q1B943_HOLLE|nr:52 kDa repressor of the inhibitor of the protein kinase [Holothuria leucospilota]